MYYVPKVAKYSKEAMTMVELYVLSYRRVSLLLHNGQQVDE